MRSLLLVAFLVTFQAQPEKLTVPSQADQRKNEKTIRDLLKDAYQRKDRNSRLQLAHSLLEAGGKEVKDWGMVFSFYKEASDVAADAMAFDLAMGAVDQLEKTFKVEPESPLTGATISTHHEIKKGLLKRTQKAVQTVDDASAYIKAALKLADIYYSEDAFDDSLAVAQMAESVAQAANDKGLQTLAKGGVRKYAGLKREHDKVAKAHLKVLADPSDADAALTWGLFLAFTIGDWDRAAPWIAKGKDSVLKEISRRESENAAPEELSDGWLAVAEKAKEAEKGRYRARARFWLEKAVLAAAGVDKLKLDKKLEDLNKLLGVVDLVKLVDPAKDFTAKGQARGAFAKLEGSKLVLSGVEFQTGFIEFPYSPPAEYTLTIVARHGGGAFAPFSVGLSDGAHQWAATVGLHHASLGIQNADGKAIEFDEATKAASSVKLGATGTFVFTVRTSGFTIAVDGHDAFDWAGDPKRLALPELLSVSRKNTLFLSSFCRYEIEKAVVVPLAGQGQKLR